MNPNDLLQIWWLVAAMLVFMMQVGFLLLETGLIQERHQAGIAVKSMMMLLASSTAYTLFGHHYVWGNSLPPLNTQEWQFYQTGFAAVTAAILSGAMAGRTTLVSNVIMAALVGAIFYPLHARMVWGDGFLSTAPFKVHDFAGSGCVHLLGGLVALAGAVAAGPRREKRDLAPNEPLPMHINPRSLPIAACGVLFLWIGWMGFNGGSIQSADHIPTVGRLVISTCLAASAGGLAVSTLAGIIRLRARESYVYAPYATLSGIMAGMVANSASCDLIAATDLNRSLVVGSVAGIFAYSANWVVQQYFRVDDPIEAIAVHAGGGIVGLIFAGLYQLPWNPWNVWPQLVDIAVLVAITVVPSWIIFKVIDVFGRLPIYGRRPIRLKSTSDEENLGLTFDDPTTRVGPPLDHFHYLPDGVKRQLYDYLILLTSMPVHIARSLYNEAGNLIEAMKELPPRKRPRESDLSKLLVLYDGLRQRIESVPDVLNRLKTGKGEPVQLEPLVQSVVEEYQERYPKVKIMFAPSGSDACVNGDKNLTHEAIRMVVSNGVRACGQRHDRRGTQLGPSVWLRIDWAPPEHNGQVFLYIEDNGVGINAEVRHHLGQPFTGFTAGRSSGLGLFFAAWITQQFGGRLHCQRARDPNGTAEDKTIFLMRFKLERGS
jgi:Amt family ammonium transporter